MKPKEIRDKSTGELTTELNELKKELFNLRFAHATNKLDNPMKLKGVRRNIARVKTVLRERQLQDIKD